MVEQAMARAWVLSFDWRGLRHLRARCPALGLAWLTRNSLAGQERLWWDGPAPEDFGGSVPRAVAAEGGPIWAPEHVDLDPDQLAEAHALGLSVVPWTVNAPENMRRLLRLGVDGLITDRPDLGRQVLVELGFAAPPGRHPIGWTHPSE
jgi:glycerophosphoryl diester phosphodiesterase